MHEHPEHVALLERWMKRYRPRELFDDEGRLRPELAALAPTGDRRMGANPQANGGRCSSTCACPITAATRSPLPRPGAVDAEATRVQGDVHPRRA